jgi:hypothetical protein
LARFGIDEPAGPVYVGLGQPFFYVIFELCLPIRLVFVFSHCKQPLRSTIYRAKYTMLPFDNRAWASLAWAFFV